MRPIVILFILFGNCLACNAQDEKSYLGGWAGTINDDFFRFDVELQKTKEGKFQILLIGRQSNNAIDLQKKGNYLYEGSYLDQLHVTLDFSDQTPIVFFRIGHHLCAINLTLEEENLWKGKWSLLLYEETPATFLMSLDTNNDGSSYASIFFEEPTFHYMLATGFRITNREIYFSDLRSRIHFRGRLKENEIELEMKFMDEKVDLVMKRRPVELWKLGEGSSSVQKGSVPIDNQDFKALVDDIKSDSLERTHSILVAQKGNLVFEHYFDGFSKDILHDTRSLAKSFAAAAIGLAIDEDFLEHENLTIKPFFERTYPQIDWGRGKDSISIFHLMTMSSGIDAIDFGLNRTSYANEGNYQSQEDWTKHILEAPMVKIPGSEGNYGSGSPHLLEPILSARLTEEVEFFLHKKLFAPLSIGDYRIQVANNSRPYFGGGWYLKPRDILKFGQLYLDQGRWEGRQIISEEWITKSMQKHKVLENTFDQNEYGFLLWHKTYELGGRSLESIEGRGAGGQYLFILPEIECVVVIMSGNYTNNKGFQPERIMQDYILPQLLD